MQLSAEQRISKLLPTACGTTEATIDVSVNPSTGATSFTSPALTVCQDATNTTYTATAANSTAIVYSVTPAAAGTIDANTGKMDWDAAFSGTAHIKAVATGFMRYSGSNGRYYSEPISRCNIVYITGINGMPGRYQYNPMQPLLPTAQP